MCDTSSFSFNGGLQLSKYKNTTTSKIGCKTNEGYIVNFSGITDETDYDKGCKLKLGSAKWEADSTSIPATKIELLSTNNAGDYDALNFSKVVIDSTQLKSTNYTNGVATTNYNINNMMLNITPAVERPVTNVITIEPEDTLKQTFIVKSDGSVRIDATAAFANESPFYVGFGTDFVDKIEYKAGVITNTEHSKVGVSNFYGKGLGSSDASLSLTYNGSVEAESRFKVYSDGIIEFTDGTNSAGFMRYNTTTAANFGLQISSDLAATLPGKLFLDSDASIAGDSSGIIHINGATNLVRGGIKFLSTDSTLDTYITASETPTYSGPFANTLGALTYTKIGNVVTVYQEGIVIAGNSTLALILCSFNLPVGFRPSTTIYQAISVEDNGTIGIGLVSCNSSGVITFLTEGHNLFAATSSDVGFFSCTFSFIAM